MDQEKFIEAIKVAVIESGKKSMQSILISPPGRQPNEKIVQLSNWFNNLTAEDKNRVREIIAESIDTAVFGFLCVLDGVKAIEDGREKGTLALYYEKDGIRRLLNDPDDDYLHDIF